MTNYLFFTGKGGVGKTSLSCATAVRLADEGQRVLIVSTDPASNLTDVLESPVSETAQAVAGAAELWAININPEVSADAYRDRVTGPLAGILPQAEIDRMKEELSGACTTEIAAFDEFSRYISGESEAGAFDVIVFDTAPTGHTLRLLELPSAWSSFSEQNPDGASCLGPSSALKSSQERYRKVVATLRDADQTTFHLVSRPEMSALKEAARTSDELHELGLSNQKLIINGVFEARDATDAFARELEAEAVAQLDAIPEQLRGLDREIYPLLPYNILGLSKLRSVFDETLQQEFLREVAGAGGENGTPPAGMEALVDDLVRDREHGLIMTMGKGGVGKTTTASRLAVAMASKGLDVLLTTTDPAAHIQDALDELGTLPETLSVERIDPKVETQRYISKVMSQKGEKRDEEGRRLLLEDLKSPCTEEVAVFHAFSKAIQQSRRKFVVIDTAPTGHTLLLLDTAGSYHREIMRTTGLDPERIMTPYKSLQDGENARILLVTLPETTPMREAAALQDDLKRAGITPYAWIVNRSLAMREGITDPVLRARAAAEVDVMKTIENELAPRLYGVPYTASRIEEAEPWV